MKTFKLTVRTPENEVFVGEATSIRLRAENGQMQVFANHASITASILFSKIIIDTENGEEAFVARRGMFAFDNKTNSATLLAFYCEHEKELDAKTAEDYLKFIEEQLAKGEDMSQFQLVYLEDERLAVQKQLQ
jgi:F0F1-type ATP synthase epsilon subunit